MSYFANFNQNVQVDNNNSSSSNLAAGAYFVGTATSTLGVNAIQVTYRSDQNAVIYVDQAPSTSLVTGRGTAAANNSTTLTGTGTKFTLDLVPGDTLVFDSGGTPQTRTVAAIASDTSLTVTVAFTGGALSGKTYQRYPWDQSDELSFYAQNPNHGGWTFQAVNAYARVRVKNTGTATSTILRLNTVLCPIVEALPRSLDEDGFLQCGIHSIVDYKNGNYFKVDQFNSIKVAEQSRLIGTKFTGTTKDTNFWTETVANGGTVTQTAGFVTLNTNTTANGSAAYLTVRSARFIPNVSNDFRAVLKLGDTGAANNVRRFGNYDANNGAFFQLSGTTFSVVTRAAGVDTVIAQANWNGVDQAFTLDTNIHSYDIEVGYQKCTFYIDGTLMHTASVAGNAALLYQSLDLPITVENTNSASSTTACTISAALLAVSRYGKIETEKTYRNIATATAGTVLKYAAGRLMRVIFGTDATQIVTLYDNTAASGTIIATLTNTVPGGGGHNTPAAIEFDCPFHVGLTVVTTTNNSVTFIYE